MENTNDTNEDQSEKTHKSFGQKVDQFIAEFNGASEKLQKEFNEKYEDLKQSAQKLKAESKNKERWKEVEDNLKNAGDDLQKAFQAAFRKKSE